MDLTIDKIIFQPKHVDLKYSPLRKYIHEETAVLGTFNPGLTKLPNGNLLLMVRVAESINNSNNNNFWVVRWISSKYILEKYYSADFYTDDPRKYIYKKYKHVKVCTLTSFSWLLPVELTPDGLEIIKVHYDKIIEPEKSYMEFGLEDARITKIYDKYYMTVCAVSSERQSTVLYESDDGLVYNCLGIIMDHQNKDMVLFPEKINGFYYALTRPLGEHYFISRPGSDVLPGPTIQLSQSPDFIHWKPCDKPFIKLYKNSNINMKAGGGCPPILTDKGWLILFHGVQQTGEIGIYRTFCAILDKEDPSKIISIDIDNPVLVSNKKLVEDLGDEHYVENVVFSTGIVEYEDKYIVASGELDQYCRITHLLKNF